jgi:hypothetical protein
VWSPSEHYLIFNQSGSDGYFAVVSIEFINGIAFAWFSDVECEAANVMNSFWGPRVEF